MQQHNLGDFIKNALLRTGCDPAVISDLDRHATVQLDLGADPCIFIGMDAGDAGSAIVLWSDLCEFSEDMLGQQWLSLLQEAESDFAYTETRQLLLRVSEQKLQLVAHVAARCQEDAGIMAELLNAFFLRQARMLELLRQ